MPNARLRSRAASRSKRRPFIKSSTSPCSPTHLKSLWMHLLTSKFGHQTYHRLTRDITTVYSHFSGPTFQISSGQRLSEKFKQQFITFSSSTSCQHIIAKTHIFELPPRRDLAAMLKTAQLHFIRCVKSNPDHKPGQVPGSSKVVCIVRLNSWQW